MDRLHSMRVFARVIEAGGFAAAGRSLNVSPAVVTRLVADLEEHLGARLINRTTRRLVLTDVGEAYLERVKAILSDVEEAEALASAAATQLSGHLRVLAPPAFAVHQLAKHLPRFRAGHPKVTLELVVPGPVETIDESFDVTILSAVGKPLDGDFVARRLAVSEVVLCAAPSYLDARGRPAHPRDLVTGHDAMLPGFAREVTLHRPGGQSETLAVARPALTTNHIDTMYATALAGLGVAGLPSFIAEDALAAGRLERVLPDWQLFETTIYAAIPTRKHMPARTRAFIDFLLQAFGGEPRDPFVKAGAAPARLQ